MKNNSAKQISQKINQLSKEDSYLDVNEIRLIFALERIIARLQSSEKLRQYIVFKGGFVLYKSFESLRFTRDVDALARHISKEELKNLVIYELQKNASDNVWFGDIRVKELIEQGEYGCYRFDMAFQIGFPDKQKIHKLSRIHLDIGFSDELVIVPEEAQLISVLKDIAPVSWKIYPIEQIVSEKLQTLIERGSVNSRAKDIYDLVYLLPKSTDSERLKKSILHTFNYRKTEIPSSFQEELESFELNQLRHAWNSIKLLSNETRDFEYVWKILLNQITRLDELFGKKSLTDLGDQKISQQEPAQGS